MGRYLFFSHDGYGLGHVRRNCIIAESLRRQEPTADIVLVTGMPKRPGWLERWGDRVVRVPPLLKGQDGEYRPLELSFEHAVERRRRIFSETVERFRPDVVVVDRHPFGTAGELREGLEAASAGARVVLGLRDVLDEPEAVAAEIGGGAWEGFGERFDGALVYGDPVLCDHRREYGLPVQPTYCGWVVDRPIRGPRDHRLLAAAAGGGGDGAAVFDLVGRVLSARPSWRAEVAVGPFGDPGAVARAASLLDGRLVARPGMSDCRELFSRAGAVIQMAGYNSTFEALAAGLRPVLVPRRHPRREQAIRAERLAALGLAHVADPSADPSQVARLLDGECVLQPGALAHAGIDLHGAERAADHIRGVARRRRAA